MSPCHSLLDDTCNYEITINEEGDKISILSLNSIKHSIKTNRKAFNSKIEHKSKFVNSAHKSIQEILWIIFKSTISFNLWIQNKLWFEIQICKWGLIPETVSTYIWCVYTFLLNSIYLLNQISINIVFTVSIFTVNALFWNLLKIVRDHKSMRRMNYDVRTDVRSVTVASTRSSSPDVF